MHFIKNQHGYALLVVLLIITVIGIFAPILVNNVLSSSKQFIKVEEQMQHEKLANMAYLYIDKSVEETAKDFEPTSDIDPLEEFISTLLLRSSDEGFFGRFESSDEKQGFRIERCKDDLCGGELTFKIITTVNGISENPIYYPIDIVIIN
ncbi:hypothetical protein BTR22_12565 [Alkalihalophilus pseudofirmus]|uniref:type II secretion system protein n=1 Tax=Alkalihalophilus pseudofirmus TaxID=79885 RepID=UPI00095357A5|nr:hypothetical protein BTR22_12565 [Alkalihalophilus pseudofirmus]